MRSHWIPACFLLGLLIAFRCLGAAFPDQLPNFSPLPAVFLCSLLLFRGKLAWMLPLGAWLFSNPIASWMQGFHPIEHWAPMATAFVALLVIGLLVLPLRRHPTTLTLLGAGLGAALIFHGLTGVVAWISYPLYDKSLMGLFQSLWSGPPGAELPSWVFLRNLVAANTLFIAIFLTARNHGLPSPVTADKPLASAR